MYSEELNKLIEASLVDGVITEKERAVIHKRAQLEGVDPDEVDMILDAELQKLSQNTKPSKQGVIKKCPSCGAVYEAGSVKCPQCGFVFVGVEANSSARQLFNKLEQIDLYYRDKEESGIFSQMLGKKMTIQKIDDEKASLIQGFPIPTSKDDLLEFIPSLESKWHHTAIGDTKGHEKMAYRSKYKECIQKAHILFGNDPVFSEFFRQYEKNKYSIDNLGPIQRLLIIFVFLLTFMVGCGGVMSHCSNKERSKEEQLVDNQFTELVKMIDDLDTPNPENYSDCKRRILSLVWKEENVSYSTKEYQKQNKSQFEEKKWAYIRVLNSVYRQKNKEDDPDLSQYLNQKWIENETDVEKAVE